MKRAPRRPYKPWFKKRKPAGRLLNRTADDSDNIDNKSSQENLEIFMGYHKKNDNTDEEEEEDSRVIEFFVDKGCPYMAWKIYFPNKVFSESADLVEIVKAMCDHFQRYPHWYDIEAIIENSMLDLRMENIIEDDALVAGWTCWYEDFKTRPEDVFNAIGLAVHSLLLADTKNNSMKKIFVRPTCFKPSITLNSITTENVGELITTRASIIHTGNTEYLTETLCYRCRSCTALISVRQKSEKEDEEFSEPSICRESCKGRKGMDPLYDSPFTMSYSRQIITVQTISHNFAQSNKAFEVVLYRDLTDAFAVGQEVLITGVVKQAVENYDDDEKVKLPFFKKKDKESNPIILRVYIKCFSMLDSSTDDSAMSRKDDTVEMNLMTKLRSDPNIFKRLLHSFCPSVAGKEVAKAFTLIGLFGGHGLMSKWRRSSIHILLLGSSGTGKSTILQAAYECAPKGMSISGANITMAGLIAGCDEHMKADAGVMGLCDNGLLYIDELDKMEREQQQAMIASMDSEVIMIHKNGCFLKIPARTNILAAANPCTEVYDYNEPVIANMSFPHDLLEKFDVVVPFLPSNEEEIEEFLMQLEQKQKPQNSINNSYFNHGNEFFGASSSSRKYHWLKKEAGENLLLISRKEIQTYIKHALDECCPKLSEEAAKVLRNFYENYSVEMTHEYEHVWSAMHNMESLIRLTLARARIDFSEVATVEHAEQVLSLFTAAQIDVYPHHDINNAATTSSHASAHNLTTMFNASLKKKDVEIGKLSKPKQMKALMEVLQNKADETGSNIFTMPKLLEIAIELGIKDYYEIINRLNYDNFLLKTPNGYRLVK